MFHRKSRKGVFKIMIMLVLSSFLIFSCATQNPSTSLTLSTSSSSIYQSSPSTQLVDANANTRSLVAIEVNKLPTRLTYTSNEVISTSGGELRLTYSDYSVKYLPMRDAMIDLTRLNIASTGSRPITLKYQEGNSIQYVSYNVTIIPFTINVTNVDLDIKTSDVLFNQNVKLNPIITPSNALVTSINWSSSNPLVARVDNNGVVTPLNAGEVIITVTVNDTFKAVSRLNIISDFNVTPITSNQVFNALSIAELGLSVTSLGEIITINTNQAGDVRYLISANSKSLEIQSLTINMDLTAANATLNGNLDSIPNIEYHHDNKYLVAVEFFNDKVISANEVQILLAELGVLDSLAVSFNGTISGNVTSTGFTLYYYVKNTSNLSILRNTYNLLTPSSKVINDLGSLVDSPPVLNINNHLQYLIVVEIEDATNLVTKISEVLITITSLNSLTLSLNYSNGIITVGSKANNDNLISYVLSTTYHFSNLLNLSTNTTVADINAQLGLDTLNSPLPTFTRSDNFKYLLVVESDNSGKITSIGNVRVVYDIYQTTINNSGIISLTPQHGGTLVYALSNSSKQTAIDSWNTLTTQSEALSSLSTYTSINNLSQLAYTSIGKYLVAIETDNGLVVSAGEALVTTINVVELVASVTGSGVKNVTKTQDSGTTIKYGLINQLVSSATISAWSTNTTESNVNTALSSTTGRVVTLNNVLDIIASDNGKYLFVAELNATNKLVAYKQVLIQLDDIIDLSITVTNQGIVEGDSKTNVSSTLYYVVYSNSKQSVIDLWNTATTQSQAISDLGNSSLSVTEPTFNNDFNDKYVIVIEILNSKILSAGESRILIQTDDQIALNQRLTYKIDFGNTDSYPTTGTSVFDLKGSYTSTLLNGPTYETNNQGIMNFDGVNEYIQTDYTFNNGRNFSISAWVNFKALSGWQTIVGQDSSIVNDFSSFYFQKVIETDPIDSNKFRFSMLTLNPENASVGNAKVVDPEPIVTNTWYFYSVSVGSDKISLYRNGELVSELNNNIPMAPVDGFALINAAYFQNVIVDYGNTKIGQVSFYNQPLTAGQMLAAYNESVSRYQEIFQNNLIVYLDASNSSSYVGTGNIWTNLVSGSKYTINNGSFSNDNGGSINFNGTSTSVQLGSLLSTGTNYTKEAWVFSTSNVGPRNIISSLKNPFWTNSGTLSAGVDLTFNYVTSPQFPLNDWYHVATTFNDTNNTMVLYINGVAVGTNINATKSYQSEILRIGAYSGGPNNGPDAFWEGKISEVRIYSSALTAQQILFNYNSTKNRFIPIINLDASNNTSYSGTGSIWTNLSGTTNATLTGSPTFTSTSGFNFNGTLNQYGVIAHNNQTDLGKNKSFSIEMWFNPASGQPNADNATLLEKWNTNNENKYPFTVRYYESTNSVAFSAYDGTNQPLIQSNGFNVNGWHHIIGVYDFSNNLLRMYKNGIEVGTPQSLASLGDINNTSNIGIAHRILSSGPTEIFKGNIAQIKIYNQALNGIQALKAYNDSRFKFSYSNIAPTSAGSGVSISNLSPFSGGGYSYLYNGTANAFLNYGSSSDWAVGNGDFTVEWFSYQTSLTSPQYQRIFSIGDYPNIYFGLSIESGTFYYWANAGGTATRSVSNASSANVWIHWAIVRRSGITTFYRNGFEIGSFSDNSNITVNNVNLTIGNTLNPIAIASLGGYLTNFRLVKDTGVYTGNFTVPTSNLTLVAGANPYGGSNTVAIPEGHTKLLIIP